MNISMNIIKGVLTQGLRVWEHLGTWSSVACRQIQTYAEASWVLKKHRNLGDAGCQGKTWGKTGGAPREYLLFFEGIQLICTLFLTFKTIAT